jgi:glycine dehydrogenase subunit 1
MPYTSHTPADIRAMLDTIGVDDVDALFKSLPAGVRPAGGLDLPDSLSEEEVWRAMSTLAGLNHAQDELISFLGGGVYDTYVPAAVEAIVSRSEFLTAYTPYQPEVSQGTLQVIYEWQTFITRLTGLPVTNASMYDGASALVEGVLMALSKTRRRKVVAPALLNPRYRRVLETHMAGEGVEIITAPAAADGRTDVDALAALLDDSVGALIVQTPNHLGRIEDGRRLAAAAAAAGALTVASVNPVSLSLLAPPAAWGAAVATGEAQPLGVSVSWGGPLLGFLACTDELKRALPGRVVGRTVDGLGRDGYVLTLQTREQHIRREKATSNICSNQGLNMCRATVYLALLGAEGFRELGEANHLRCAALRAALLAVPDASLPFDGPVFNEFVLRIPGSARAFRDFARTQGVLAGIPLDGFAGCGPGDLLVSVTERRSADEIAYYADVLRDFLAGDGEDAR